MQQGNKKKKWGEPKLIILIRGKPEERVLAVCKTGVLAGSVEYKNTGECNMWRVCRVCSTRIGT